MTELITTEEFAQQHYNIPRDEFVMMSKFYYDDRQLQEKAIEHFDEIQYEIQKYYREVWI